MLGLLLCVAPANAEEATWHRIMTDLGSPETSWIICSSPSHALRKTFDLKFPAEEITNAAVEYEIAENPYDRQQKIKVNGKNANLQYAWSNLAIRVNGQVVLNEPAGPYIYKGVHRVMIPVKILRDGQNIIEFGWDEKSSAQARGYIYFAVDLTEEEKQRLTIPSKTRPAPNPNSLRLRLLVQF